MKNIMKLFKKLFHFFHEIQKLKSMKYIFKINEKSNQEIPRFFKISRDTSRPKIEPGSRDPGN